MGNKILITGGEGFVGSHLSKVISSISYDLKSGQDIFDIELLEKSLEGVETVIHLAALISVNESIDHPGKYYSINVAGTDTVMRSAIKAGCKNFIFASSAAVYNPENPYGLSKVIGEKLMEEFKDRIKTVSLRFFNIYGPGQNPEYAGVISKFFDDVRNKKDLVISGDGDQTRDFISVTDIAEITKRITENIDDITSGSVYELGTGTSVSINELADYFVKKYHVSVSHSDSEPIGILNSTAENTELVNVIGDFQFTPLTLGLDHLAKEFGL